MREEGGSRKLRKPVGEWSAMRIECEMRVETASVIRRKKSRREPEKEDEPRERQRKVKQMSRVETKEKKRDFVRKASASHNRMTRLL